MNDSITIDHEEMELEQTRKVKEKETTTDYANVLVPCQHRGQIGYWGKMNFFCC